MNEKHTASAVIVIAGLFMSGACASDVAAGRASQAESLVGIYEVSEDQTNNADHDTAEFSVFRSQFVPAQYGLFFLQRKGEYKGGGFSCERATYIPGLEALSCFKPFGFGATDKHEVALSGLEFLTVGAPGSRFCSTLGERENGPRKKVVVDDCDELNTDKTTYTACACYEIKLICFGAAGNAGGGPCAGNDATDGEGGAPPGAGAGSGGQH